MPTVEVKNLKNEVIGELQLSDDVFGAPLNQPLIYDAVRWFMAKQRAGTASTKTRAEVSGAGAEAMEALGARLRRRLHEALGVTVEVTVLPPRTLERSVGKAQRVRDLRQPV